MLARAFIRLLLILACGLGAGALHATESLVVIAHPGSHIDSMSRAQVINLFLGRYKKLPSGERAVVLDNIARKELFYQRLVNKTLAEINAYWARLTFSGQTTPPRQEDEMQVLRRVASTPGAVSYVDKRFVDDRVRIVHELTP